MPRIVQFGWSVALSLALAVSPGLAEEPQGAAGPPAPSEALQGLVTKLSSDPPPTPEQIQEALRAARLDVWQVADELLARDLKAAVSRVIATLPDGARAPLKRYVAIKEKTPRDQGRAALAARARALLEREESGAARELLGASIEAITGEPAAPFDLTSTHMLLLFAESCSLDGRTREALPQIEQALERATLAGHAHSRACALILKAHAQREAQDLAASEASLKQGIALLRDNHDVRLRLRAELDLGRIALRRARVIDGVPMLQNAARGLAAIGDYGHAGFARLTLGEHLSYYGDSEAAIELLRAGLEDARRADAGALEQHLHLGLATAHRRAGHLDRAEIALRKLLEHDHLLAAAVPMAHLEWGHIHNARAELGKALSRYESARDHAARDRPDALPVISGAIAGIYMQMGALERALEMYEDILARARESGETARVHQSEGAVASTLVGLSDYDAALRCLRPVSHVPRPRAVQQASSSFSRCSPPRSGGAATQCWRAPTSSAPRASSNAPPMRCDPYRSPWRSAPWSMS